MNTRKATPFELFHNLTLAFREDPQFQYEYNYSAATLALIETPYWRLTPAQQAERNAMIEQTMANGSAEDTRVRLMAMRPEHRYMLIPSYVCQAATEFYRQQLGTVTEEPETVDLMPIIWSAVYALDLAREMPVQKWNQMTLAEQRSQLKAVDKALSTLKLSRYVTDASRAVWLGLFMTFSDSPDDFYDLLISG